MKIFQSLICLFILNITQTNAAERWATSHPDFKIDDIEGGVSITDYSSFASKDVAIPSIIDGANVVEIGANAFNNDNITSVIIPNSIRVISDYAFFGCLLSDLTIPSSVTSIGKSAFTANNLTSLTLSSGLISIGDYAFSQNDLLSLYIPNSVIQIGDWSFYRNKISSVYIPANVKTVGRGAFSENNISNLSISKGVKKIENSAFASNKIASVTIPNSVDSIGYGSFSNNILTNVLFEAPTGILHLEANAFIGNNINSVFIPKNKNSEVIGYRKENWFVTFNETATISEFDAAYLARIPDTISENYFVLDNGIIQSCSYDFENRDVIVSDTLYNQSVKGIADGGVFYSKRISYIKLPVSMKMIGSDAFGENFLTSIILPDSIINIGSNAFYDNSLTSITLNNGLLSIGENAFGGNDLTSVNIPNSVTTIGDYAFYNNSLSSLTIPTGVTNIGYSAFSSNNLNSVSFEEPASILKIYGQAFKSNNLSSFTLPIHKNEKLHGYLGILTTEETQHEEGEVIFDLTKTYYARVPYTLTDADVVMSNGIIQSCSYSFELKDIIIPDTLQGQAVTGIKSAINSSNGVFYNKNITTIELPATIDSIGDYAFGRNSLKSIEIPDSCIEIGKNTFTYNSLTSINIPNKVVSIGEDAFSFNSLTSVNIPNSVVEIGAWAFGGNNLTSIQIPNSANIIGSCAFCENSLTDITIPKSVTQIENWAFSKNNLDSVNFEAPSAIINIGYSAFADNIRLNSIVLPSHLQDNFLGYKGRENNVSDEILLEAGESITDFSIRYYARIPYTLNDTNVIIDNGVIQSCSYDFELTDIAIPDTLQGQKVTGIKSANSSSEGVFYYKDITFIQLPTSIDTIGDYAFCYNSLTSIDLPDSVILIGKSAFRYNSLTSLHIPENVIEIGQSSFSDNAIVNISLPNSVKTIHDWAFNNNKLSNVTIPNSVNEIAYEAFSNNNLTNVTFLEPSAIVEISLNAFSSNIGLTGIKLPIHKHHHFLGYRTFSSPKIDFDAGATITDFTVTYYARIPYTLTDNDVIMNNGTIQSCSYSSYTKDIKIPDTLHAQLVTGIKDADILDNGVFYKKGITSVILPNTIVNIGDYAFYSNALTDIIIPDSVVAIGKDAFSFNSITSISLPDGLTTIGAGAFALNDIIDLWLPNSLIEIGSSAFSQNSLTNITIPNNVTEIGSQAFISNYLTQVSFMEPSSILNVGTSAFEGNNDLTSLKLPSHKREDFLGYIGQDHWQTKLILLDEGETITDFSNSYSTRLPYTIKDADVVIDDGIIQSCSYNFQYKDIIIPNSLGGQTVKGLVSSDSWDTGVFSNKSIITVKIPTELTSIGAYAFSDNYLINVDLSDSLKIIGNGAFGSNSLTSVNLPNSVVKIGEYAFSNNSLINIRIPDSTTIIGSGAFVSNNLTSLTIPKGVEELGNRAFDHNNLSSVDFAEPAGIMNIDNNAFINNPDLAGIILPDHSHANFSHYSNSSKVFTPGETITNFEVSYEAIIELQSSVNSPSITEPICYPNPVKNSTLHITLPDEINSKPCLVTITSLTGSIIFLDNITPTENLLEIDVNSLESGFYTLRISNTNGYRATSNFIVD